MAPMHRRTFLERLLALLALSGVAGVGTSAGVESERETEISNLPAATPVRRPRPACLSCEARFCRYAVEARRQAPVLR